MITKTKLTAPEKSFSVDYQVIVEDIKTIVGVSRSLADALQAAINEEIMHETFKMIADIENWYRLKISTPRDLITKDWLEKNIKYDCRCFALNYWYFKDKDDASTFALYWKD